MDHKCHGADLTWLAGQRLQSFSRREYDWPVTFDGGASLVIQCLWRLIEDRRIRFTSQDEGQKFGLPAPVDAAAEVARRLTGSIVEAVELQDGTLDLHIRFTDGHELQIIPDSSGYEAWSLTGHSNRYFATGGGGLEIFAEG
jgi:Family of unknown function (DUF6188)